MDANTFVKRVAELTAFDRDRSALLTRTTLVTLGTRITPGEADDLAAQLPEPLDACVRHESDPCRFKPDEFQRRVARIVPLANEQAQDAIQSVVLVLTEAISDGEVREVLGQLGADYERLLGLPTGPHASAA
jgi:uncharacterized protein (DUF2267 family)